MRLKEQPARERAERLLDLLLNDADWADWSEGTLAKYGEAGPLFINLVIYSEISGGFERIEELERAIQIAAFQTLDIPKEALFLAGKADNARIIPLYRPTFFLGLTQLAMSGGVLHPTARVGVHLDLPVVEHGRQLLRHFRVGIDQAVGLARVLFQVK